MKRKSRCYFIFVLFVVGFLACGDSGDEGVDPPTQPTTQSQTQTSVPNEAAEIQPEEIDFAAEETAIQELFTAYATDVSEHNLKETLGHWLQKDSRDIFMAQCFVGKALFNMIEGIKGIENSLKGDFASNRGPLTVTIAAVGVDKRAKAATLRGTYKWGPFASGQFVAAFEKDTKDNWKIRAIDFCDQDLIEEIQTPKPE